MNAPVRLGLYGVVLVVVFAVGAVVANAVVPDGTVRSWTRDAQSGGHAGAGDGHGAEGDATTDAHGGHESGPPALGLGLEQDGYRLASVAAPSAVGTDGRISFVIAGPDGTPVLDFETQHEKELHLIVVRADGQHFRHVHPVRAADGTWSIPWQWEAGGSYRVFADFVPARAGGGVTLSTSVQVGGDYAPVPTRQTRTVSVDGYDVTVDGDLVAGQSSVLTLTVTRDGAPVTTLEPYLGAFGHLVALREGDLAYLHAHPHGAAPQPDQTSGPEIVFETTAPTPGRYLLYLDFRIDGRVHTAPLVIDAVA